MESFISFMLGVFDENFLENFLELWITKNVIIMKIIVIYVSYGII